MASSSTFQSTRKHVYSGITSLYHLPYKSYFQNYGYAHNGYGYGQGYYEAAMYPSYYPNNYNGYELNIPHDSNSFLPTDCSDCIFISGLPKNIQKEEIINAFSTVGKIKVAKGNLYPIQTPSNICLGTQRIFLFLDRKTKDPIGDATVTFTSAESAQKAIEVFNNTDFNGHGEIKVQIAKPEQKNPFAEMLVSVCSAYCVNRHKILGSEKTERGKQLRNARM